jgi:hypothetical protein
LKDEQDGGERDDRAEGDVAPAVWSPASCSACASGSAAFNC